MVAAGALLAVSAAVVAALVGPARACEGYSAQQVSIKPCPGTTNTNGVSFIDIKPELTSDCKLRANGCIITNKTLQTVNISYLVKKDGMVVARVDNKDGCKFLDDHKDDENIKPISHAFQLPNKCPLQPGKVCGDGKTVDLGNYKNKLGLFAGTYTARVETDHGDQGKSCFDGGFKIQGNNLLG